MTGPAEPDDPDLLRAEVARTREQLAETVQALVARADVRERMRHGAAGVKQQAVNRAAGAKAALGQARGPGAARRGAGMLARAVRGRGALLAVGVTVAVVVGVRRARQRRRR